MASTVRPNKSHEGQDDVENKLRLSEVGRFWVLLPLLGSKPERDGEKRETKTARIFDRIPLSMADVETLSERRRRIMEGVSSLN